MVAWVRPNSSSRSSLKLSESYMPLLKGLFTLGWELNWLVDLPKAYTTSRSLHYVELSCCVEGPMAMISCYPREIHLVMKTHQNCLD